MAARILAIACLVLAFAQPFIPEKGSKAIGKKGITSLYLDNSLSMESEVNNKRYLDLATSRLSDLLGVFQNATSLQLVTNDFSSQEQGLYRAEKIRDMLTTIGLSHTTRTLTDVYNRQQNLIERHYSDGQNQLFWFSDFQKSTVGKLSDIKTDSSNQLILVPVQGALEKNIYVDSAWLSTPFIRELQNNVLNVKVSNSGKEEARNIVLKLTLDNTQVSTASVNVAANGSAVAKFNFNITGKGYKKGQITFDDFPVTFDNSYFFVLNASPLIKILHLSGDASFVSPIPNVYSNDSLFSLQRSNVQNLDPGLIKNTDLVILENITQIGGSLAQELQQLVTNGGSVVIIPPAHPDQNSYSTLLSSFGVSLANEKTTNSEQIPLTAPDRSNPFFADVFEESARNESNLALPGAAPVWSWSGGQKLLTLSNGQAYLSQLTPGKGKVYLFSSPFSDAYSTLSQHALFVPVMYKIAAMSVKAQRTAYTFDENPISLTIDHAKPNTIFKLKRDKTEIIPVQRLNGNQLLLEIPQGDQLGEGLNAGYFDLIQDNKIEQMIAINHNNKESKLDYYSPDELKNIFAGQKNVQVFKSLEDSDFIKEFEQQNMGTSLWKYFLYGAMFFLLAEILLIRFKR